MLMASLWDRPEFQNARRINDMADMEAIYAWTEIDDGGDEGIIFAAIPIIGISGNLQHRRLDIVVKHFRPIAIEHARVTGHTVRLVKFARSETLDTL